MASADEIVHETPGVYFDNAATTYPKPEAVYAAMDRFARKIGGSGGRGDHQRSVDAYDVIEGARESIQALFGAPNPEYVCFSLNATEALNTAIYGLARPGCHVVTTSMEHNSVILPLVDLEHRMDCRLTVVQADQQGFCRTRQIEEALSKDTSLVVVTAASNVTGTLMPLLEIGQICRQRHIPLVVDAAQVAGAYPFDLREIHAAVLTFTGHKSLLGPQGTGGMVVSEEWADHISPLKRGGTGTSLGPLEQPQSLPHKFEAGTTNGHGIAGLAAGVDFIRERGIEQIRRHEMELWRYFREGLRDIPHVKVFGPTQVDESVGIVSLTVEQMEPNDVGFLLDARHRIQIRAGLHCAPLAHRTIGTMPKGTVRFSFGWANTIAEVDQALDALARIRDEN